VLIEVEHLVNHILGGVLTWLGDMGTTPGRTAGELPEGVPKSGRGGMKGVAGSECMMEECLILFFHGLSCSHTKN
jgi:hypothetical protein